MLVVSLKASFTLHRVSDVPRVAALLNVTAVRERLCDIRRASCPRQRNTISWKKYREPRLTLSQLVSHIYHIHAAITTA